MVVQEDFVFHKTTRLEHFKINSAICCNVIISSQISWFQDQYIQPFDFSVAGDNCVTSSMVTANRKCEDVKAMNSPHNNNQG